MDGVPHEHRVAKAQEIRKRQGGFVRARTLLYRKVRVGEIRVRHDAAQDCSVGDLPDGLAPFLAIPLRRTGASARRLAFLGRLAPETGAADLLRAAQAWAERYCEQTIRILWIGEGELKGVLIAQPVPENLVQIFRPASASPQLAAVLGRCGMLVAPTEADDTGYRISAAMAAGLPIVASSREPNAARWVSRDRTGWLFDPRAPAALAQALERALATPDAVLDRMRERVRERAISEETLRVVSVTTRPPIARAPTGEPSYGLG